MTYEEQIAMALPDVRERIQAARQRAGLSHDALLVAVTKGHDAEAVRAAQKAGLSVCGENRVAELEEKVELLGRDFVRWHLIGHLQRNKARKAVTLFDLIHSIDSVELAHVLDTEARKAGVVIHGLLQVNASGEESKGGVEAADAERSLDEIHGLANVRVQGLMTMAPFTDNEAILRKTFSQTRDARDRCVSAGLLHGSELSMGMSNDFEIAIEEGSTMVRLGTVLFGERAGGG